MKKCVQFCIVIMLLVTVRSNAQDSYNDRAQKYIKQYASLAILEQQKNGIPAAVTLGQGLLETEAGNSELMTDANNHFGIKCGKGWDGLTYSHTDDAPNECFKKYSCAAESYRDHSEHLKRNPRYASLFSLSQTDYAGWAVCLKKCGYATNPQYAQRLIKIIEDFKLQEYTYSAINNTAPAADFSEAKPVANAVLDVKTEAEEVDTDTVAEAKATDVDPIKRIADSAANFIKNLQAQADQDRIDSQANAKAHNYENSKLVIVNGLKAFYAYKDEMLLQYAMKFNVRYPKLLEMNDLPDAPLPFNTYVYVEKKLASGTHTQHAVKEGETMLMISELESIQLKRLEALNLMQPGEEPAVGALLQLQFPARQKPALAATVKPAGNLITADAPAPVAVSASPLPPSAGSSAPVPAPTNRAVIKLTQRNPSATRAISSTEVAATAAAHPTATDPKENYISDAEARKIAEASLTDNDTETDTEEEVDTNEIYKPVMPKGADAPEKKRQYDPAKKYIQAAGRAEQATSLPLSSTNASKSKYYTVQKGDTAFSIAKRNNVELAKLQEWNNFTDGNIMVGQTLRVKE